MSTPKNRDAMGMDRFERNNPDMDRSLEDSLGVQGEEDEDEAALAADAEGGTPSDSEQAFDEADEEADDVIPLPDETLSRGSRQP